MNPSHIIEKTLGNPIKVKILRHLMAGEGRTGRELSRLVLATPPAVLGHLHELTSTGIISQSNVGKSHVYRLNPRQWFVQHALLPLFKEESELITQFARRLVQHLDPTPIETMILYGSLARGQGTETSDWDILVLTKGPGAISKLAHALEEALPDLRSRFSSTIDVKVFTAKRYCQKFMKGDGFARSVYDDYLNSQIPNPLWGKSLTEVINAYAKKN